MRLHQWETHCISLVTTLVKGPSAAARLNLDSHSDPEMLACGWAATLFFLDGSFLRSRRSDPHQDRVITPILWSTTF